MVTDKQVRRLFALIKTGKNQEIAASRALPIPPGCNKPELLAHCRPYPIEGTHDPEYELSMVQHEFVEDDPIPLYPI